MMPRFAFASLVALMSAAASFAATPLARLVPENAALVVQIQDAPELLRKWKDSPWAKSWNDEQMKRYFAPLRAQMKIDEWDEMSKKETGYSVSELLSFATGDAVLLVPDFDFVQHGEDAMPPMLIGLDVGENASKIEGLLKKAREEKTGEEETTEFAGVTVHTFTPKAPEEGKAEPPTHWAVVEGKWLISPVKEALLSAIDTVKKGGVDNPWDRSERYVRLKREVGDAQILFYVNAETVYPAVVAAVKARQNDSEESQKGPFNFDPQALLTALGLDTWRDLYVSIQLADDATELHAALTYTEARGLTKLLAYRDGPPEQPAFVGSSWATVSTAKFSVKEAYAALEEMLEAFSPPLSGMVQGKIRELNNKLKIDLKRDLIGSLGDTAVAASLVRPQTQADTGVKPLEQLLAFSVENPDALTTALDALRQSMGPNAETMFVTRDYLGSKIVTFAPGGPQPGPNSKSISYSITNGYFFLAVGSAAPVELALQDLNGKRPGLWTKPEVREAWSRLPSNASAFQYQDVRALVSNAFETLSMAASMYGPKQPPVKPADEEEGEAPESEPSKAPVDPTQQPDPETIAKYWSHAWGYAVRDNRGVHSVYRVIYPQ